MKNISERMYLYWVRDMPVFHTLRTHGKKSVCVCREGGGCIGNSFLYGQPGEVFTNNSSLLHSAILPSYLMKQQHSSSNFVYKSNTPCQGWCWWWRYLRRGLPGMPTRQLLHLSDFFHELRRNVCHALRPFSRRKRQVAGAISLRIICTPSGNTVFSQHLWWSFFFSSKIKSAHRTRCSGL